ncbi:protein UBASH3A homolog [Hyalella azteca]|uniref:Ecdysteroid-phosphate phosphatase n=1 Tax=Hyalella azteca TaxID=294128 RepID=A0A979FGP7_HYAAZ|nr:protein UBASH3A homolog [Hyalella azteca]
MSLRSTDLNMQPYPVQYNQSLELLQQMGFPYKRAQKALAATGNRSVQLASDWLAAHYNDPELDEIQAREYVLYLRPAGPLNTQIYEFWEQMLENVGRNAAQNLMPHITLCSHFKVSDEHSAELSEMMTSAAKSVLSATPLPLPLPLEKYISPNYMGLFVTSPAAPVLHSLKRHFIQLATSVCPGVSGSTTEEDLHLTLAYGYTTQQFLKLEQYVKTVQASAPASWELCLYSREPRFNGLDLYKSVRRHRPSHSDELALMADEYVVINGNDASSDGWVRGVSWLTGCSGLVALVCLVRVPDSDAWTLHRSLTIGADGFSLDVSDDDCAPQVFAEELVPSPPPRSSSCHGTTFECDPLPSGLSLSLLNILGHSEGSRRSMASLLGAGSSECVKNPLYNCPPYRTHRSISEEGSSEKSPETTRRSHRTILPSNFGSLTRSTPSLVFPIPGPRRLIVMRHGERADFTFGDWCKVCFDKEGRYKQADLNLQPSVPSRADMPQAFIKDCPLTRIGEMQAQLVGEGFAATHTPIHHVYCSPSLRCVMTATSVLRAMKLMDRMPLKIEPGLFEWLAWYPEGVPRFMTNEELTSAAFNIDLSYRPVLSTSKLSTDETCEQYYARSSQVTNSILAATKFQGGSVLLVAHAASLDTCTRQLVGAHPRNSSGMTSLVQKVPYCAVAVAEESPAEGLCNLVEPPFRSPTHASNPSYDWTIWRQ